MKHTITNSYNGTFQVNVIEYDGTNIGRVSLFIKQYGTEIQSVLVSQKHINNNALYLMYVPPWGKADEEDPQKGDRYCIHPDKQCYIYTSGEFFANFKPVPG